MGRVGVWLVVALTIGFGGCSGCNNGSPPGFAPPPLDRTIASTLYDEVSFLFTGNQAVQTGVVPGTIERLRVSVLRGAVRDRGMAPLADVRVHVLDHPEFGETKTRSDGNYDFAVNGGRALTLIFERDGSPIVHRQVQPVWRDWVVLDDVVMTPVDGAVSVVDFSSMPSMTAMRGSKVTDGDGTRQATVLFAAGTTAMMRMPGGGTVPLGMAHLRATEFTVGDSGPNAMPAALPANSAYTYAVQLSADEAEQAGATAVEFSQLAALYVENFIHLPVGTLMPVGFYDRARGVWVPSDNGIVLGIVSITGGLAEVDLTGDGVADDPKMLGISDDERQKLASMYAAGTSLWRSPLPHFSTVDCNLPYGPVGDPTILQEDSNTDQHDDQPWNGGGSIIECQNQVLGEEIGVPGTPFTLTYRSDRVPGRLAAYTVQIPIINNNVPMGLQRIDLQITVAGQYITKSFPPTPNQTYAFTWNRKDGMGNLVQGSQPITVRTGYVYKGGYQQPPMFGANGNGISITTSMARQEATIWTVWTGRIGPWDAQPLGFGGWTLSPHHAYDPDGHILYYGDGRQKSARTLGRIIDTIAGLATQLPQDGQPAKQALVDVSHGVAVDSANNVYFSDSSAAVVRMIDRTGNMFRVAGTGVHGSDGNGGPATQATLTYPDSLAFDADGNLLIVDSGANCIRKVDQNGIITLFAGDGMAASGGDEGPATAAHIRPFAIAAAPDHSVYITELMSNGIRHVTSDGIIHSMQLMGDVSDEPTLPESIAINPVNGKLYVADTGNHRIGAFLDDDTNIEIIAGTGTAGYAGDGGPATDALLTEPVGLAFGPDGTLYFSQSLDGVVRAIGANGFIYTIAGYAGGDPGDGGPAEAAKMEEPFGLAVAPDGDLIIGDQFQNHVRRVHPPLPGLSLTGIAVAESDGLSVYEFDGNGRHLKTVSALTGATLYTFNYDGGGRLASITDIDNQTTAITRDAKGRATQIKSPFNVTTTLGYDASDWLHSVKNAANESISLTASSDGLLQSLTDPRGGIHTFTYDMQGRLASDADPTGATQTLTRTDQGNGAYHVDLASSLGRVTRCAVGRIPGKNGQRNIMTDAAGFSITQDVGTDGKTVTTRPDGTVTSSRVGADPRFGMQVPIPLDQTLVFPSGLTLHTAAQRSVTLGAESDPLSLVTLSDTIAVNDKSLSLVYDATSQTATVSTAVGRMASALFDSAGRTVRARLPGLADLVRQYDAGGMLSGISQSSRTWSFTYNSSGFLSTVRDPLGQTANLAYDAVGRPTSLTLPGGRSFAYAPDASSNLTSLKMPLNATYTFTYDGRDLLKTTTEPALASGTTGQMWSFDADRNLASVTLADGAMVALTYDAFGRPQSWAVGSDSIGFSYEPVAGRLQQLTYGGSTLAFTYDGFLPVAWTWSGSVAGMVRFDFDGNLRLVGETVNGGVTTSFTYDDDGLLTGAGPLALQRDPTSGMLQGTSVGMAADAITYDEFGAVAAYHASYGGTTQLAASYEYDTLGRLTKQTEAVGGATHVDEYGYDAAGRLASLTRDGASAAMWTYDADGNRTSGGAVYDAQDRLSSSTGASYDYDKRGRRIARSDGSGKTVYRWNGLGRLVGVDLPSGMHVDYVFDPAGRVVGRKLNGTLTQGFLYRNALFPAAELDGTGAVVATFVYASRLSVPDLVLRGGKTYRIWSDVRGSPRLLVDIGSGAVAEQIAYDTWGRITGGGSTLQPFGFSGGLYDATTGLVLFGARWYDPAEGRWLSKDPLGILTGDSNVYAYVQNDPVNLVDPTGLQSWPTIKNSFLHGIADAQTGGVTTALAEQVNIDGAIDPCPEASPTAFKAGQYYGYMAGLVGGLRGGGGGAGGELPGEYLAGKAPQQVAPGTTVLEGQYVNDLGRVEPWTAHYDEYGRLIGRTDYNAGNLAQGIPDTHYHVYDWSDPGQPGHEILAHVPGVFKP